MNMNQAIYSSYGEDEFPGSGGNLNTIYSGAGSLEKGNPANVGYSWGYFPAGALSSGAENQEFRISDSNAFNNLRGIAKTSFPFEPYPTSDGNVSSLADNFEQNDMAGLSSLLPGKYTYDSSLGTLSQNILDEFNAGTSTFNSLPSAATAYGVENEDERRRGMSRMYSDQIQHGISTSNIADQFRASFTEAIPEDVPLTPFSKTYLNFAESGGKVDYGFSEPGADAASEDIIRAFHAVLPEGQLAGTKKELMPVFSGIAQEAVEQRPMLQSLGKLKNTLYLGGLTELPDDLRISPEEALLAQSNIPGDLVQTGGELARALELLGENRENKLHTGNPYGRANRYSKMVGQNELPVIPDNFYDYLNTNAREPVVFAGNSPFPLDEIDDGMLV